MTHITCRMTAKNWDQLQNPMLALCIHSFLTQWQIPAEVDWLS